jgi:hypothetical protein
MIKTFNITFSVKTRGIGTYGITDKIQDLVDESGILYEHRRHPAQRAVAVSVLGEVE